MAYDFMNDPVKSIKGVYNAAKGFFGGGGG